MSRPSGISERRTSKAYARAYTGKLQILQRFLHCIFYRTTGQASRAEAWCFGMDYVLVRSACAAENCFTASLGIRQRRAMTHQRTYIYPGRIQVLDAMFMEENGHLFDCVGL